MTRPPVVDIDLAAFKADPYPTLARLRAEAPIAFVRQLNGITFARHADITVAEKDVEVFSSDQPDGLMTRLMGHNMMRKDGAAHVAERKVMLPALTTKTVREVWMEQFEAIADELLDTLSARDEVDLMPEFALPFSGRCLVAITGLRNVSYLDLDAWSQAMIDGIANYAGDPAVEARCHSATAAIEAAIAQCLPAVIAKPDHSLLSVMHRSGMSRDSLDANIKLSISGGQNEPRDAIGTMIWALLRHPEQQRSVMSGQLSWMQALDETLRWISPIGMSPRRIARAYCFNGIDLEPEQRVFFLFGSANRDETVFERADLFDCSRDASRHIAFGAGPHFCAGAWASKAMIAGVALPRFFARFPDAKLADPAAVRFDGWAFRGPVSLPVRLGRSRRSDLR